MIKDEILDSELEREAEAFLEQADRQHGKNQVGSSLGTAISMQMESNISGANDSPWKKVPLTNLPSQGLFYPDGAELTIRAADVSEIRHWSTMDENDLLEVNDTINFVIEKCCRFKVDGGRMWLSWKDITDIDRLYIVFLIHEITFPRGQNQLLAKIECTDGCPSEDPYYEEVLVRSSMLQLFELPEEVRQWYSNEYKCFVVESAKLNEVFYLYVPTIGTVDRIRAVISEIKKSGAKIDKSFLKIVQYLVQDWSKFNKAEYIKLQNETMSWHINKFTFVVKFAEMMNSASKSEFMMLCPKCGSKITKSLFSRTSFTVKDLFLISGRLNELV